MEVVYFITEAELKENSPINLNVEPKLISLAIVDAQDIYIQDALGTLLYKKIIELVKSGDIKTPTYIKYKFLLDEYIIPAVIYWSIVESLNYVRYKIMNKSVTTQASENTMPVELAEIKYFQDAMTNKAEHRSQRIINYLSDCDVKPFYPEYDETTGQDISPSGNAFFSGMQLD
jgi:hypothetical protein